MRTNVVITIISGVILVCCALCGEAASPGQQPGVDTAAPASGTIVVNEGAQQDIPRVIEELATVADAKVLCERFMMKLMQAGTQAAFDELTPYFALPQNEISMLARETYQQLEMTSPRFGNAIGYTFVGQEQRANTVLKLTYLQKYEKHAMRWEFYFYKPHKTWLFNAFYFDDKLKELFGSSHDVRS